MNEIERSRHDILALEATMQDMDGYDHEGKEICKITHYFAPGVYAREMWMPAGCLITGKIHLTEHLNVLSQGKVSVSNKGESIIMEAPHMFVSPIGTKRAIYAHEESTWTTIHATELTDPEEIENEIIAESFQVLDGLLARNDYEKFLLEFGIDENDVQEATHLTEVSVVKNAKFIIGKSEISGLGLFPSVSIKAGELIAPALFQGKKTEAGRFTNHSGAPNAEMVMIDKDNINLVAIEDITDEEITTDYRNTLTIQGLQRMK
jgi:hypothetical protein